MRSHIAKFYHSLTNKIIFKIILDIYYLPHKTSIKIKNILISLWIFLNSIIFWFSSIQFKEPKFGIISELILRGLENRKLKQKTWPNVNSCHFYTILGFLLTQPLGQNFKIRASLGFYSVDSIRFDFFCLLQYRLVSLDPIDTNVCRDFIVFLVMVWCVFPHYCIVMYHSVLHCINID